MKGHDCIVCPYHGWAFDEGGTLQAVPAAEHSNEWPKMPILEGYHVEEKVLPTTIFPPTQGLLWYFWLSNAFGVGLALGSIIVLLCF